MPICGVAVNPQARPVADEELAAMAGSLYLVPSASAAFDGTPQARLGAVANGGGAEINCDDCLIVVCDADLHNSRELRRHVSADPDTHTAALLAQLYRKFGIGFVEKLRGAFSIAVWDKRTQTLVLAIDRFAVKPLCYALVESGVVFASQARALFAGGRHDKRLAPPILAHYFNYGTVPAPYSVFAGVSKLSPGSCLVWKDGQARATVYWDMSYPESARGSTGQLARQLLSLMEESVRSAAEGVETSKVGCFLSGGTDSSSVLGLLTSAKREPVNSFSIGFAEPRFNELEYARIAARRFASRHYEYLLGPAEALETIPKIVRAYDEPFANSSAIPTYWCARLAREHHVDVMLAGDGGDELFGGNERYCTEQVFQLYQELPRAVRKGLLEPLLFAVPLEFGPWGKARRYVRRSNTPNPERYCQWRLLQVFPPGQVLAPLLHPQKGNGDLLAAMRRHYAAAPARSELNRLLYVDVKMTLGDDDLPKVTRTCEIAGVSVRFPLLDHGLAEFSGTLPASLKVRRLQKRYLFKQATRHLLPQEILKKKKHGFGLPIGYWLKADPQLRAFGHDVLLAPRTYQRGYFQREFIEELFANMNRDDTPYYGDLLWLFLMLELWHREHVEGGAC